MRQYLRSLTVIRRITRFSAPPLNVAWLMVGAGLLEYACYDLIQWRVLHADVEHRVTVQDGRHDLGNAGALNLQRCRRSHALGHFAEALKVVGCAVASELQLYEL